MVQLFVLISFYFTLIYLCRGPVAVDKEGLCPTTDIPPPKLNLLKVVLLWNLCQVDAMFSENRVFKNGHERQWVPKRFF